MSFFIATSSAIFIPMPLSTSISGAVETNPFPAFWENIRALHWEKGETSRLRCLACGRESPCPLILSTPNLLQPQQILALYRCPECQSHFYHPLPETRYSEKKYSKEAIHYLCMQGISIEFSLHALSALPEKKGRFLDVGCGPGFMVDLWERQQLGSALGIEPSPSGDFGRDKLHRTIRAQHLEEDQRSECEPFDIVLCTEVLEHVPDPVSFLRALSKKVAPQGTLVFSTPNTGPISPDGPTAINLMEALSPGFHVTLFSEKALRTLLAGLDWPCVHLVAHEGHWIVYASRQTFSLQSDLAWAARTHRTYLLRGSEDSALAPETRSLFCYRLFREIANQGLWKEAESLIPQLMDFLPSPLSSWIQDPLAAPPDSVMSPDRLSQWVGEGPYLPAFVYLMGIRAKNHLGDIPSSIELFKLASRLADILVHQCLDDAYTKEIFWVARMDAGIALLETGRETEGLRVLRHISTSLDNAGNQEKRLVPQLKFATRARLEIFKHHILRENWESARIERAALQGFLAWHYDPAALQISWWLSHETLPADFWTPFWYFYCDNMLSLNTGCASKAAAGLKQLHVLCGKMKNHMEAAHLQAPALLQAKRATALAARSGRLFSWI
jgi:2-polyprenyl-3-methyl-5-hydroxy-6-metoxy-1,4-benzoquinol methylase